MPIVFSGGTGPIFSKPRVVAHLSGFAHFQEKIAEMLARFQQIENICDLREYVNTTICDYYQLQEGAYSLTERVLWRAGKPCGIFFCLHGPRATKFTAIWETERNQVLFYGSSGERFMKIQLLDAPPLETVAA